MVFLKFISAVIGTFSVELERFGSWTICFSDEAQDGMISIL
jgi:hypothetical protein